jgi:hypothetical protein
MWQTWHRCASRLVAGGRRHTSRWSGSAWQGSQARCGAAGWPEFGGPEGSSSVWVRHEGLSAGG